MKELQVNTKKPKPIDISFSEFLRFLTKVEDYRDSSKCWEWKAGHATGGYGRFKSHGETFQAHRVSYTVLIKIIPDGLSLDHLCRNRNCVNPFHLEPVTLGENVRRGETGKWQTMKTHCPQGHEFKPDNIYWKKYNNGKLSRGCATCGRDQQRQYNARRRSMSELMKNDEER